eukprot:12413030-Karenia_brevis.AAC.1
MAQDVTKPAKVAAAMGGCCGHHRVHAVDKSANDGGEPSATVSNIYASRRSGPAASKKPGDANSSSRSCIQSLGIGSQFHRGQSGRQDRNLRSLNSAGHGNMVGPNLENVNSRKGSRELSMAFFSRESGTGVQPSMCRLEDTGFETVSVRPPTRRSKRRSAAASSKCGGGQKTRALDCRQQPASLWEADKADGGIDQAAKAGHQFRSARRLTFARAFVDGAKASHLARSKCSTKGSQATARGVVSDNILVKRLRAELKYALRKARRHQYRVFLELYAGVGKVSFHMSKLGFASIALEIENGDHYNVLNPSIKKLIHGWLTSGVVMGAWLGTPCSTWSRARRGPQGSGWGPLRNNAHLFGLPGLSSTDVHK